MATSTRHPDSRENTETTYSTKRVLMRAEHQDKLKIEGASESGCSSDVPGTVVVIRRDQTYYGPRLRVESLSTGTQYIITAPGPESEAVLWHSTSEGWKVVREVALDFDDSIPQYDICLHCNEPLSTVEHRRRAAVGACVR